MAEFDEEGYLDTAKRAASVWHLDIDAIELTSRSENVVYRLITTAGRQYALRIHRPGYSSLDELNSELLWAQGLREAGITVPHHLLTPDGFAFVELPLEGTGVPHHIGVIEWIEGEQLARLIDRADKTELLMHFHQLGRLIGRVHSQADDWTVPKGFARRSWDADALVGEAPFWGRFWEAPQLDSKGRKLLYDAKQRIHRILIEYGQDPASYGLIHADLHPRNVLIDGSRVQIIDFDDSGYGWHHYEIAVAIFDYRFRPDFAAIRDSLVKGYRSVRSLPSEVVGLLPMFLFIRSLVSLGWINGRPELEAGDWVRYHADAVCKAAEGFLGGC